MSYQVPLADKRGSVVKNIDLLAYSIESGALALIELKQENNQTDSPVYAFFEVMAYCAWLQNQKDNFIKEFKKRLKKLDILNNGKISKWQVVLLAPENYWNHWEYPPCNLHLPSKCAEVDVICCSIRLKEGKLVVKDTDNVYTINENATFEIIKSNNKKCL